MRSVLVIIIGIIVLAVVGERAFVAVRTGQVLSDRQVQKQKVKETEDELNSAVLKLDYSDPSSFKHMTNLKTEGGKVISQLVSEVLKLQQNSKIEENVDVLAASEEEADLRDTRQCKKLVADSQKVMVSAEVYSRDIKALFHQWAAKGASGGGFDEWQANILKSNRLNYEWAKAVRDFGTFCLKHKPTFVDDTWLFDEKCVAEANRLYDRWYETETRLIKYAEDSDKQLKRDQEKLRASRS